MTTGPSFSIVVPTYERPNRLRELLESLICLDYPRERFEVVVIDDGGTEPLEPIVGPFRDRLPLRFERVSHRGCGPARQAGIERANGEYVVFTDDDCRPASDWLRALEQRIAAAPGCVVGGRVVNGLPDNPCADASQLLISYLYHAHNADPEDARFFATNNVAVPREALLEVGGIDRRWSISGGEERDLWMRWRQSGRRMVYAPDAVVQHRHPLTLRSLWRQHYNYGRGAYRFHSGCHAPDRPRVPLQRPAFYLRLPLFAWSRRSGRRAWLCACLLLVTQLANATGWLRELIEQAGLEPAGERAKG